MKGILFSVAFTLMGLIVLGAALSLAQARNRENIDVLKLSIYDRVFDETKSIDNSYSSLLSNVIELGIEGNNVTFRENLPNPGAADFLLDSSKFIAFAKKYKDFEMEINIDEGLPIFVMPENILYTHPNGFGGNKILVTNASSIKKYDINLLFNVSVSSNWTTKDTDPDGLEVHIHIEPGGYDETTFLDRILSSVFKISSANGFVSLTFDSNSLDITSSNLSADITNSITVNTKKPLFLTLNEESINITVPEYKFSKTGPVRIL